LLPWCLWFLALSNAAQTCHVYAIRLTDDMKVQCSCASSAMKGNTEKIEQLNFQLYNKGFVCYSSLDTGGLIPKQDGVGKYMLCSSGALKAISEGTKSPEGTSTPCSPANVAFAVRHSEHATLDIVCTVPVPLQTYARSKHTKSTCSGGLCRSSTRSYPRELCDKSQRVRSKRSVFVLKSGFMGNAFFLLFLG